MVVCRENSDAADVSFLCYGNPEEQNLFVSDGGHGGSGPGLGFDYVCVLKTDQLAGVVVVIVAESLPSLEVFLPDLVPGNAWRLEPGGDWDGGTTTVLQR